MLSFPCFSKYLESFLDVRTYSIVFPRKIVVARVIPFPRVIASPSLLVKKKIDTIYSFLLHPFTLAHSAPGSVCQKKKSHGCHCRLRHLEGDAKVESDPDWLIYELFESIQRNQIEREQSSFVPQSAKTTTTKNETARFLIWHRLECACSVYLMSLSHEERLPTRKI